MSRWWRVSLGYSFQPGKADLAAIGMELIESTATSTPYDRQAEPPTSALLMFCMEWASYLADSLFTEACMSRWQTLIRNGPLGVRDGGRRLR